jgi:DNA mismatch repair protein MutS2
MQSEPKDLYIKLEFDKILDLVQEECLGELGRERVLAIEPDTKAFLIQRKLTEVEEYRKMLDESIGFPITAYKDISKDLEYLEIIDYVLSLESLQRVYIVLHATSKIISFFSGPRRNEYPTLYLPVERIAFDVALGKAIDKVVDEKGNIKPDASPVLLKIRRLMSSKMQELDKKFRSLIIEYRKKGYLADTVESMRNGRRVFAVLAESKRKIRGIIHDESASGKTAFIEPDPIIKINNDLFDLENEEKREIYKILKELSGLLRPYSQQLRNYTQVIVHYDVIQAKAQFARSINGVKPKVKDVSSLHTLRGYHPLLLLKNKALGKKVVPFDLNLHDPNRVLVLSGPNAGGKSITMKSVGLLQLMMQSGLLVPVDEKSEMGIFHGLFADIGDQQSIEDDLSTYSSRLQNMRVFLEKADQRSLILIDEFGSGTDPKTGGAIAEAILKELNHRKVYGVITTHYSNLKMFAYKTKGIVNGSMVFDKDDLKPTYEMRVGKPGSSYAFEIAQSSGLPENVLSYARHKTGKNERAVDELLIDLQREKQELEAETGKMKEREAKLEKLIKTYDNMYRDLEFKKKKFKLESKEQTLQEVAGSNKDFEKLVREIREEKNLEKAKELAAQVKEERKTLASEVTNLREDVYYKPTEAAHAKKEIQVGDFVKLRTGGTTGTVESINKNKATVIMGIMKMTAHLRDLMPANEPLEIKRGKSINLRTLQDKVAFESKLDIRGLRRDEALKILEVFVDKAIMSAATQLRIVHGKGDGVLRKAVVKKLREYDAVEGTSHPEAKEGGDGVTIVEMG